MRLKEFFSGARKPEIYELELNDIVVSKEMSRIMVRVEEKLQELKDLLSKSDVVVKDAALSELENSFLKLKSKVDGVLADVKRILDIEVQNKDYLTIHDDGYLEDKYKRLELLSDVLEDLLQLISQKPSVDELRESLLKFMYERVNIMVDSVNNVINDDKHLESTYAKLTNI